ncbi:SRPBCC family protein [Nocardia brasiliensis]|uniref:SRPBCC family protein n=1 Tax=Nocardia brasiliensis TaxID=37326 RepID=UPI003D90EEB7
MIEHDPLMLSHGSVTVALPSDKAFKFFTQSFGAWWPSAYHIGRARMADAILEPEAGGRWFERGVDGTEHEWGRILEWESPYRLLLTWQINGHWQYDPDPRRASEIEVRFIAGGSDRTRVHLAHHYLNRLVEGHVVWQTIEDGGGWHGVLETFAAIAEAQA